MFTANNNMIDAKKSRVRQYCQIPSHKEIGFVKFTLIFKLSKIKLSFHSLLDYLHVFMVLQEYHRVCYWIYNI